MPEVSNLRGKCMNQRNSHEDSLLTNVDIELSIVIPCYNEEEALPVSIPPLLDLCRELNLRYEVILVNNGSWDSTPKVIDSFISQGYPVRRVDVPVNQGPGWGVICGLKEARGNYIGFMAADGQIQARDVLRTYKAIQGTQRGVVAKTQRINRMDGWLRRGVSWVFNLLFRILFGAITEDVNGEPKFFHREDLQLLKPTSKDAFLNAELMIKANILGFNIVEVPLTFQQRRGGISAVRVMPISLEFLKNMIQFRWGKGIKDWLAEERRHEE